MFNLFKRVRARSEGRRNATADPAAIAASTPTTAAALPNSVTSPEISPRQQACAAAWERLSAPVQRLRAAAKSLSFVSGAAMWEFVESRATPCLNDSAVQIKVPEPFLIMGAVPAPTSASGAGGPKKQRKLAVVLGDMNDLGDGESLVIVGFQGVVCLLPPAKLLPLLGIASRCGCGHFELLLHKVSPEVRSLAAPSTARRTDLATVEAGEYQTGSSHSNTAAKVRPGTAAVAVARHDAAGRPGCGSSGGGGGLMLNSSSNMQRWSGGHRQFGAGGGGSARVSGGLAGAGALHLCLLVECLSFAHCALSLLSEETPFMDIVGNLGVEGERTEVRDGPAVLACLYNNTMSDAQGVISLRALMSPHSTEGLRVALSLAHFAMRNLGRHMVPTPVLQMFASHYEGTEQKRKQRVSMRQAEERQAAAAAAAAAVTATTKASASVYSASAGGGEEKHPTTGSPLAPHRAPERARSFTGAGGLTPAPLYSERKGSGDSNTGANGDSKGQYRHHTVVERLARSRKSRSSICEPLPASDPVSMTLLMVPNHDRDALLLLVSFMSRLLANVPPHSDFFLMSLVGVFYDVMVDVAQSTNSPLFVAGLVQNHHVLVHAELSRASRGLRRSKDEKLILAKRFGVQTVDRSSWDSIFRNALCQCAEAWSSEQRRQAISYAAELLETVKPVALSSRPVQAVQASSGSGTPSTATMTDEGSGDDDGVNQEVRACVNALVHAFELTLQRAAPVMPAFVWEVLVRTKEYFPRDQVSRRYAENAALGELLTEPRLKMVCLLGALCRLLNCAGGGDAGIELVICRRMICKAVAPHTVDYPRDRIIELLLSLDADTRNAIASGKAGDTATTQLRLQAGGRQEGAQAFGFVEMHARVRAQLRAAGGTLPGNELVN